MRGHLWWEMGFQGLRKPCYEVVKFIICEFFLTVFCVCGSDCLLVSMTFGFGMAAIIGLYSDKVSLEYKGLMIIPNITVASVVACRLFRELRLGMIPL